MPGAEPGGPPGRRSTVDRWRTRSSSRLFRCPPRTQATTRRGSPRDPVLSQATHVLLSPSENVPDAPRWRNSPCICRRMTCHVRGFPPTRSANRSHLLHHSGRNLAPPLARLVFASGRTGGDFFCLTTSHSSVSSKFGLPGKYGTFGICPGCLERAPEIACEEGEIPSPLWKAPRRVQLLVQRGRVAMNRKVARSISLRSTGRQEPQNKTCIHHAV